MNGKEKEELNRWCHKFMGYCLSRNEDCGCTPRDYTESLDLASIVEAKILDMDLGQKYMVHLAGLVEINSERWSRADTQPEGWTLIHLSACDGFMLATAPPQSRCKAARAAVEGEA